MGITLTEFSSKIRVIGSGPSNTMTVDGRLALMGVQTGALHIASR